MALTSQQRSWCVLEFHKTNSVVTVQRAFKLKFNLILSVVVYRRWRDSLLATSFKGQAVREELFLDCVTDSLFRNVGIRLPTFFSG
jgi:hypothetical protein